mgnify:CR=1 FL=1
MEREREREIEREKGNEGGWGQGYEGKEAKATTLKSIFVPMQNQTLITYILCLVLRGGM